MKWEAWLVAVVLCLAVFGGLGFIKFTQIKAAIAFGESFPEPSETVDSVVAKWSSHQPMLKVPGEVLATRTLDIRNELEGIIVTVGFSSGGLVEQGDVLIQLDVADERAQLDGINAQIELNQLEARRLTKLAKNNASSQSQLDRARAELAISQAQARSLTTIIAKKTLKAPFSGRVGLHQFEVGGYLPANSLIAKLVGDLETIWIDFSIPQSFADIAIGTQIEVLDNQQYHPLGLAKVIALDQQLSKLSRNIRVRALFDNTSARFKPGASASIRLPVGEPVSVMRLPDTAIRHDSFGSFVFTLQKDNNQQYRASRKPVEVFANEGRVALVASGLDDTELVAAKGSFKLKEGMLVNLSTQSVHGGAN